MKTLSLTLVLLLLGKTVYSQIFSWQRNFTCTEFAKSHSICQSNNHSFNLSEINNSYFGHSDLLITKRDPIGEILWNKIIGSSKIESGKNAVIRSLSDESLLIIGFSKQTEFTDRDVFCCKLSFEGEVIWSKTLPFLNGHEVPRDAIELDNGDLVIIGSIVSQSFGSTDGFILRLDSQGNMLWGKNIGGSQNEHFYGVTSIQDELILTGTCQSFDNTHRGWMVKCSLDGFIISEKVFSLNSTELFMSVKSDNNNIYTVGYTTDFIGDRHLWVCSLSMNLVPQWCAVAEQVSEGVDIHLIEDRIVVIGNKFTEIGSEVTILNLTTNSELISSFSSPANSNCAVAAVSGVSALKDNSLLITHTAFGQNDTLGVVSKLDINTLSSCGFEEESIDYQLHQLNYNSIVSSTQSLLYFTNYPLETETLNSYSDSLVCFEDCDSFLDFPNQMCSGNFLSIDYSDSQNSDYSWSHNGVTILNQDSVYIDSSSNEAITINFSSLSQIEACAFDSIFDILLQPNPGALNFDTTICAGVFTLPEIPQLSSFDYSWDTQDQSNSFIAEANFELFGNYSNVCGTSEFSLNVSVIRNQPLEPFSDFSCDTIDFNLTPNHSWASSTESSSEIVVLPYTFFEDTLIYEVNGCIFTTPLSIQVPDKLPEINSCSTHVCLDSLSVQIDEIETTFGVNYLQSSTNSNNVFTIDFIFENQCGEQLLPLALNVKVCECSITSIFLPNAFTPNNDGLNDDFQVISECNFETFQLSIFNRFGELIFQSTSPHQPWLGNVHNGEHYAPDGVYNWQLISSAPDQPPTRQTGHVTLLR